MQNLVVDKTHFEGVSSGRVLYLRYPMDRGWKSWLAMAYGLPEEQRETITQNIRNRMPGTRDKEIEITLQCGAEEIETTAKAQIEEKDGLENLIIRFVRIKARRKIEKVEGEIVDENEDREEARGENASAPPAVRKMIAATGVCRFCGQVVMIEAPDGASAQQRNEIATDCCDCDDAKREHARKEHVRAAREWAKNIFGAGDELNAAMACIETVSTGIWKDARWKKGKTTFRVWLSKEDMIMTQTEYRDSQTEEF